MVGGNQSVGPAIFSVQPSSLSRESGEVSHSHSAPTLARVLRDKPKLDATIVGSEYSVDIEVSEKGFGVKGKWSSGFSNTPHIQPTKETYL